MQKVPGEQHSKGRCKLPLTSFVLFGVLELIGVLREQGFIWNNKDESSQIIRSSLTPYFSTN